jgi:hypothetical protein
MSAKRSSKALSLRSDSVYPGTVGEAIERVSKFGFGCFSTQDPFTERIGSVTYFWRGLGGVTVGLAIERVSKLGFVDFSTQGSLAEGKGSDTSFGRGNRRSDSGKL